MLASFCIFTGCKTLLTGKKSNMNIERQLVLDSVSSGSGLVLHKGTAFIISDNVDGLFSIDTATLQETFYPFSDNGLRVVQVKNAKRDFENATLAKLYGEEQLIAFGSGSVAISRENILLVSLEKPLKHKIIEAAPFYAHLQTTLSISPQQMNIEGCFVAGDSLYLLNRGTNAFIAMKMQEFEEMVSTRFAILPNLSQRHYKLPLLQKYQSGFSGACAADQGHFLFTASVEKTDNWFDDGEIAGSFIGLANLQGNIVALQPLNGNNGKIMLEKIESIELLSHTGNSYRVLAISDNDNAKSTWFELTLNF